ncbi:MAG: CvpA family protein [Deltaproteobacteria bacterium]|nr:CvpA family protein [Deltaproteobacteria bacterium]
MISFGDLTSFDVIVALIFLIFLIRGVWIGFMRQFTTFLALVGSYWLAGRYSGQVMPYVQQVVENPKVVFLASFALLFLVSALVFILAGKVLRRVMEISLLGWFDRFLGLLLGAVKGALVAVLLFMILASSLSASNDLLKKSLSSPYLSQGAEMVRKIIHDPEIRKQFIPREPAIKAGALPGSEAKVISEEEKEQEKLKAVR